MWLQYLVAILERGEASYDDGYFDVSVRNLRP
ncbi:Uncharacterised protein [Vibrio cholerae]|nr:Uncharacterised protein [Vibrio cholerae]CSI53166.1 Uncharacterised protein [Vibrio cholerae]CSI80444.1 Uncharacterised protein [Vibrio cholerae]